MFSKEVSDIESIVVSSDYEGSTFENSVSTLQDAYKIRDLKLAEHGVSNVKILAKNSDGWSTIS